MKRPVLSPDADGDEMQMPVAPDEIAKAGERGDCYYVTLPAASADFVVEGTQGNMLFVDYLRHTFACGGFPGWHARADKPTEIEAEPGFAAGFLKRLLKKASRHRLLARKAFSAGS